MVSQKRKPILVVWAPSGPKVILSYLGEVPAYLLDSYFDFIFLVKLIQNALFFVFRKE